MFYRISKLTLGSILSSYVQRKMKANHRNHNTLAKIKEYYQSYKHSIANREEPGVILRISDHIEISPVLVARFILEGYLREKEELKLKEISENGKPTDDSLEWTFSRSDITRLLRFTDEIDNQELAYEVYLSTVYDDQYGPFPDAIKQTIGAQHEQILKDKLMSLKISFADETILRQQGYDKTPDFKLDIPLAIGDRVINWIESKATFGDEETHQTYLDEQLLSYWNRYGPGLVIYWLGFMDTLTVRTTPGIMIRDNLPSDITFFNPNSDSRYQSSQESTNKQKSAAKAIRF